MTKEEFSNSLKALEDQHRKAKRALIHKYAVANNPYKVGDIVEDHFHIIKIESMKSTHGFDGFGEMVFEGVELKKDLTQKKRQVNRFTCQANIKRKLN